MQMYYQGDGHLLCYFYGIYCDISILEKNAFGCMWLIMKNGEK